MIADARAVALRWPDPRLRVLAELATVVADAPWQLSAAFRARAAEVGLGDAELLHAISLGAQFGHLNRIADATAVPLDYQVELAAPAVEPAAPMLLAAPAVVHGAPAIDRALRPATATTFDAWRDELFGRTAPLDREVRARLVDRVRGLLGAAPLPPSAPADPVLALADLVVLAPWRLDAAAFAPLRAAGFDDRALFDVCATASSATVFARVDVALIALAR